MLRTDLSHAEWRKAELSTDTGECVEVAIISA